MTCLGTSLLSTGRWEHPPTAKWVLSRTGSTRQLLAWPDCVLSCYPKSNLKIQACVYSQQWGEKQNKTKNQKNTLKSFLLLCQNRKSWSNRGYKCLSLVESPRKSNSAELGQFGGGWGRESIHSPLSQTGCWVSHEVPSNGKESEVPREGAFPPSWAHLGNQTLTKSLIILPCPWQHFSRN